MQLPDVNVLICAHREDAPEHERYAAWLQRLTTSDEPFALSDVVLSSFLRIVTNPHLRPAHTDGQGPRLLPTAGGLASRFAHHAEPPAL